MKCCPEVRKHSTVFPYILFDERNIRLLHTSEKMREIIVLLPKTKEQFPKMCNLSKFKLSFLYLIFDSGLLHTF